MMPHVKGGEIMKEYSDLANAMVVFRAKNRLSQKELAEQCGVSLQTINSIENDVQTPSKVTEAKIRLVIDAEKGE
jgi:DNA-binding XRE family transcriptional regulator